MHAGLFNKLVNALYPNIWLEENVTGSFGP